MKKVLYKGNKLDAKIGTVEVLWMITALIGVRLMDYQKFATSYVCRLNINTRTDDGPGTVL